VRRRALRFISGKSVSRIFPEISRMEDEASWWLSESMHGLEESKKMFGMRWLHADNVYLACVLWWARNEYTRLSSSTWLGLAFFANRRNTLYNAIYWTSGSPQTARTVSIPVVVRAQPLPMPLLCSISRKDTYTPSLIVISLLVEVGPDLYKFGSISSTWTKLRSCALLSICCSTRAPH
jgi:hypothetical protein